MIRRLRFSALAKLPTRLVRSTMERTVLAVERLVKAPLPGITVHGGEPT
jgi:hypothetical protein